jgi:Ca2+/H+ antiporter
VARWLKPSLNWLLPLMPLVVVLRYFVAPEEHVLLFVLAGIAIVPLAGWMGKATEHLAILALMFYFLPESAPAAE